MRKTTIREVGQVFSNQQIETVKELLLRIETLEKKVNRLMGV